ncbi:MAG: hypothetical protein PHW82_05650 [Bacteroidales bacterium]|nr:hypothetical protein [Bacteroidales bacterium]
MKINLYKYPAYNQEPYLSAKNELFGENYYIIDIIIVILHLNKNDDFGKIWELFNLNEEIGGHYDEILNVVDLIIKTTECHTAIESAFSGFKKTLNDESLKIFINKRNDDRYAFYVYAMNKKLQSIYWHNYFLEKDILSTDIVEYLDFIEDKWAKIEFLKKLVSNNPLPIHIYYLLENNKELRTKNWYLYFLSLKPSFGLYKMMNEFFKNK